MFFYLKLKQTSFSSRSIKKKKSIRKNKIRKNKYLLTLLKSRKRNKKIAIRILVKLYAINVIKKITMQIFASSQKTNIDLRNFRAND